MPRLALRVSLFAAFFAFLVLGEAGAKAYYQPKDEMISRAFVIAVITLSEVKDIESTGKTWTYRQQGSAIVEQVLKGDIPAAFTLHGSESFICARCPLAPGRFLAFLRKDGELWVGSNWHLSLRPVSGKTVEWFAGDESRFTMKATSLDDVLTEIRAMVRTSAAPPPVAKAAEVSKP